MSNFPIENMVKLTYNIIRGDYMSEYCLDCWNRINGTNDEESKYIISKDIYLCEGCAEFKNVVIEERKHYYKRKFNFIFFPLRVLYFFWRLLILPYLYYQYRKREKMGYYDK